MTVGAGVKALTLRLGWMKNAPCQGQPPEVFFPDDGPDRAPDYSVARQICAGCDLIDQCLADDFKYQERGIRYGFRAGMRPKERARYFGRMRDGAIT